MCYLHGTRDEAGYDAMCLHALVYAGRACDESCCGARIEAWVALTVIREMPTPRTPEATAALDAAVAVYLAAIEETGHLGEATGRLHDVRNELARIERDGDDALVSDLALAFVAGPMH